MKALWFALLLPMALTGSAAVLLLLLVRSCLALAKKEPPLLLASSIALLFFLLPLPLLLPGCLAKGTAAAPLQSSLIHVLAQKQPSLSVYSGSLQFAALSPLARIISVLPAVWLAGFLLLLAKAAYQRLRFTKALCRARILQKEETLRFHIPVYKLSGTFSPFACGIIKPAVYLPQTVSLNTEAGRLVLLHELTHIQKGHLVLKAAAHAAAVLHWYSPFAWLLQRQIDTACELHCDQTVTRSMNACQRKQYAAILVGLAGANGGMAGASLSAAGRQLTCRVRALRSPDPPKLRTACSCLTAAALLLFAFTAGAFGANTVRGTAVSMAMLQKALTHTADFAPSAQTSEGSLQSPQNLIDLAWPIPEYRYCSRVQATGLVIAAQAGTPVLAPADGVVLAVSDEGPNGGFGKTVVLLHSTEPDISTSFSHCETLAVQPGESVSKGQQIGTVGNEEAVGGAMCRFQIKINGELYAPSKWFSQDYFFPF